MKIDAKRVMDELCSVCRLDGHRYPATREKRRGWVHVFLRHANGAVIHAKPCLAGFVHSILEQEEGTTKMAIPKVTYTPGMAAIPATPDKWNVEFRATIIRSDGALYISGGIDPRGCEPDTVRIIEPEALLACLDAALGGEVVEKRGEKPAKYVPKVGDVVRWPHSEIDYIVSEVSERCSGKYLCPKTGWSDWFSAPLDSGRFGAYYHRPATLEERKAAGITDPSEHRKGESRNAGHSRLDDEQSAGPTSPDGSTSSEATGCEEPPEEHAASPRPKFVRVTDLRGDKTQPLTVGKVYEVVEWWEPHGSPVIENDRGDEWLLSGNGAEADSGPKYSHLASWVPVDSPVAEIIKLLRKACKDAAAHLLEMSKDNPSEKDGMVFESLTSALDATSNWDS